MTSTAAHRREPKRRAERLKLLQRIHKQWPFFYALPPNANTVLAKSNRGIHITISGLAAGLRNTG